MSGKTYVVLGLMSGTSLDGVDAAFLETNGEWVSKFGPSLMLPYSQSNKETLTQATQAALRWQFKGSRPNSFAAAEDVINQTHAKAIEQLGRENPDWMAKLDLIGFHGQTVLHHAPKSGQVGKTLQLGTGQSLADTFGVPVVSDFRTADVAAGGQGAPLAPIYHEALAHKAQLDVCSGILNIGGVSNITLISDDNILATDCGPGNGPLDNWTAQTISQNYDEDGQLSVSGTPDFDIIEYWLERDFFKVPIPRSADRYDFDVAADIAEKSPEDGAATLAAFCALGIARTLDSMDASPDVIVLCGGGRHNKAMRWMLAEHTASRIALAEDMGWDGDAIEAQAFAYLAVRSKRGLPISFPMTTGVPKPITGGRIAYPSSNLGSRGGT